MRKLSPPLIDLDWEACKTRRFDDFEPKENYMTPPEFVAYAFQAMDAYVAVIAVACLDEETEGVLTATCSLKQAPDGRLALELVSRLNDALLPVSQMTMVDLLDTFPKVLRGQGIDLETVFFLPGAGCAMSFEYPGQMQLSKTRYLDRPNDLWPEATMNVEISPELKARAKKIVDFTRLSAAKSEPS